MVTAKQFSASIQKVLKEDVVKVFSFTAIATLVKVLTSFVSVKVVAVLIGPSGIALLGQLTNFSSIILSVANGGINAGVTKYVAEFKGRKNILRLYIGTAFHITLFCSVLCGIFLVLFSDYLSKEVLLDQKYNYVFQFFGFTVILFSFNSLLVSILNGYKEFKKFVIVGIATSITGLIFTVSLVWFFGLKGALISAVTFQSVVFFISLFLVFKSPWFSKEKLTGGFSLKIVKKYAGFSVMALTSAATIPVAQLLIRSQLINSLDVNQAGFWEAMNKMSGIYLMVITTSFGVYYLPRLSEVHEKDELKKEVLKAIKFIFPVLAFIFSIIYFFRDFVIQLLFSNDFYPIRELFIWQFSGDAFKMGAWIFSYVLISKSLIVVFITAEIIFSVLLVLFSYIFIELNGLVGATQGYLLAYIAYFLMMVLFFYFKILKKG